MVKRWRESLFSFSKEGKMKVKIGTDERWPDFFITPDDSQYYERELDLSKDFIEKILRITKEYNDLQDKLKELVNW